MAAIQPAEPVQPPARAAASQEPETPPAPAAAPAEHRGTWTLSPEDEALIAKLPLRKKIGQMFIIGFMGTTLEYGLGETITALNPGGLVVFGRNIQTARQISDLIVGAQQTSLKSTRLPLLVSVDQEGGNVIRIKTSPSLPSALAIGSSGEPQIAEVAGQATGHLLRTLGFNMNLAPVLDVSNPSEMSFVGTRSYGSDPAHVGKMASRFAAGLDSVGIIPTGKHFPGHGGVEDDSHKGTPEKEISMQEWEKTDGVPFMEMQKRFSSRWAVMLAHVAYPQIDPSGMPATFSKPIVEGILRKQLGFGGVVMTDDIEMAGAFAVKDVRERAIRAIEAGVDMVMVAWNKKLQRELVATVEKAVQTGRIPMSRIDASLRRIIAAKRAVQREIKRPTTDELRLAIRNPRFAKIGQATLLAKFNKPPDKTEIDFKDYASDKSIVLFTANAKFAESFKSSVKNKRVSLRPLTPGRPQDIDRTMRANPQSVGVIFVSGQQAAKLAGGVSEDVARRMLMVTAEAEGMLQNYESYRHISFVYYRHPQLGGFVGRHFFGEEQIRTPAATKPAEKSEVGSTEGEP